MGGVRVWTAGLLAAVMLGSMAGPADAASRITPEYFGVHDDSAEPDTAGVWGAARLWAAWCSIQPTKPGPETPTATESATAYLGRAYETYANSGTRRLTLSLGHPSPWVFNDNGKAQSKNISTVWYCDKAKANTAFPSVSSLRSGPVREAYVAYVKGVIEAAQPYLEANPKNKLVLQAWNEPNLGNGGAVSAKIPGSAKTWSQAARSLRKQEKLIRSVAKRMIPEQYEITTPAMYGKPTPLGDAYFKAQAKRRTVDSVSLNFYTIHTSQMSMNDSIALWRKWAVRAKTVVTQHASLRKLPIWITETNHNLVNWISDQSNLTRAWASKKKQKRMVEVTTMEALLQGFAGIMWYQGTLTQAAVNTRAGTPAARASAALRDELVGRRVIKCSTAASTTTCTLSGRSDSGRIKVSWSAKGKRGVKITG